MMEEIHKLRAQISNIVVATFPGTDADLKARLTPPNDRQVN
jgi:ATP-dependent RNA helicase DHX37/DHR1